jgi:hypothetical protein
VQHSGDAVPNNITTCLPTASFSAASSYRQPRQIADHGSLAYGEAAIAAFAKSCRRARGYGISCSLAHASHCRQAVSNCALASSSVAASVGPSISGFPAHDTQSGE